MKYSKVTINGVTIQDNSSLTNPRKVLKLSYDKDTAQPVSEAKIELAVSITDLVTLQNNQLVEIYKSVDNVTFKRIFYGYITDFSSEGTKIIVNCKNRMYDLVRKTINKNYTSTGPESGILTSIAQDMIETYGGLSSRIVSSTLAIDSFKCVNVSIQTKLVSIQQALDNYTLYYDDENDEVVLEPRGYVNSGITLQTSLNVVGIPKWTKDTSYMINRLRIDGATINTTITESGQIGVTSGYTTSSITLTKTPISAEVLMDSSNPPTTQLLGGSKDGTTGNDYYIDSENKQIISISAFTTNYYAKINYVWAAPAPVEMENTESINTYGLFESQMTLSDITSAADAEVRATNILAKRSTPFYTIELKTNEVISVGNMASINDLINRTAVNGQYMVSKISYNYPQGYDELELGDKYFRMADWQESTETRLKNLEDANATSDDILRILTQVTNSIPKLEPRYRKLTLNEYNLTYGGSIWGNSVKPWGQGKWGTHSDVFNEDITYFVQQYLDEYTEDFIDYDFCDTTYTTCSGWGI